MTAARSVFAQDTTPIRKANWLGRYLEVEKDAAVEINAALEEAQRAIFKQLDALGSENFSTGVRRAQLNMALKVVRDTLRETFGSVGNTIRSKSGKAAVAAVDAGLFDERGVLNRLFPNAIERQRYANSLRRTAERDIQATVTRILQTQQPLSGRVWKSQALANGMVSRAVNNALARGDSAEILARQVRDLVRPDVPGGVSYAAKRLARTEINNAFHAQSIADTQDRPWVNQMRWNLSKVHDDDPGDACEDYATQGLFDKEHVPPKPHPNCRCFVTPELLDYESFEQQLLMGHYDSYIDGVMGENYSASKGLSASGGTEYTGFNPQPVTPGDYFASAESTVAVSKLLEDKYPGLQITNMNGGSVPLEEAKEVARALDEMMQAYPENSLKALVFGPGPDGEWARTIRENDGTSTIRWNTLYSSHPDELGAGAQLSEVQGFHVPNSGARPYYANTIHEFGHVLDNDTNQSARDNVQNTLLDYYLEKFPLTDAEKAPYEAADLEDRMTLMNIVNSREGQNFYEWTAEALPSKYGLDSSYGDVNSAEALAEALTDVTLNGKDAQDVSHVLVNMMLDERDNNFQRVNGLEVGSQLFSVSEDYSVATSGAIETDMRPTNFAGKDVEFIADTLRNYYGVDTGSDLGFNDVDMDTKNARELGNAFVDMHTAFPEVEIMRIQNEDFVDDSYAVTYPGPGYSYISLNKKYFSDRMELVNSESGGVATKHADGSVAPGFHPKGAVQEPARSIYIHEFGHALDNWIQGYLGRDEDWVHPLEGDVYKALWNQFQGTKGEEIPEVLSDKDGAAWEVWQRKNLAGYSFNQYKESDGLNVNIAEALAEAFDDIQRNGYTGALEGSKAINEVFMNKYEEALAERERRLASKRKA